MSVLGLILITWVVLNETLCSAPRPLTNELEPDDEDSNTDKLDEVVRIVIVIENNHCFRDFIFKRCKFFGIIKSN